MEIYMAYLFSLSETMKMSPRKSLSLLLPCTVLFTNFFHPTVQTDSLSLSLSFPLTFAPVKSENSAPNKAKLLSSSDEPRFDHQKNAVASSPPFTYRSPSVYSLALIAFVRIGTPSQIQQVVLDTGSQLSWIHCNNNETSMNKSYKTPTFNPSLSSSFRGMDCNSADCRISSSTLEATCDTNRRCHFSSFYADGTYLEGNLVRENFTFSDIPRITPRLILGCANKSDSSGAQGILGMNLGPLSFISQLRVAKFSYCVPLKINNNTSPNGAFYLGDNPNSRTFQYINLWVISKSQSLPSLDPLAYAVPSASINIGGEKFNISKEVGASGSVQTIIDSGTHYTYIANPAYTKVKEKIANLARPRSKEPYGYEGPLNTCFHGNSSEIGQMIGDMEFEFENDVKISIPKERVLDDVGRGMSCLAILSSDSLGASNNIIGNFHQQGLWVEFDVKRKLVGFGKFGCS